MKGKLIEIGEPYIIKRSAGWFLEVLTSEELASAGPSSTEEQAKQRLDEVRADMKRQVH